MVLCGKLGFCMHYLITVRPIVAPLAGQITTFQQRGRKFEYWEICLLLKKVLYRMFEALEAVYKFVAIFS
jgi:hypothetical protein